ncbi:hypothetical protein L596_011915 [Steinernema carpocapsae]|uniref:Uncharacterized protein n=1 Tax=Steinernema carpocapsae TaxID=34508 RepID=A0A4U5NWB1_STECR|nr:hypothetical protein L596_011915 [Steinernema carpocapsae]
MKTDFKVVFAAVSTAMIQMFGAWVREAQLNTEKELCPRGAKRTKQLRGASLRSQHVTNTHAFLCFVLRGKKDNNEEDAEGPRRQKATICLHRPNLQGEGSTPPPRRSLHNTINEFRKKANSVTVSKGHQVLEKFELINDS